MPKRITRSPFLCARQRHAEENRRLFGTRDQRSFVWLLSALRPPLPQPQFGCAREGHARCVQLLKETLRGTEELCYDARSHDQIVLCLLLGASKLYGSTTIPLIWLHFPEERFAARVAMAQWAVYTDMRRSKVSGEAIALAAVHLLASKGATLPRSMIKSKNTQLFRLAFRNGGTIEDFAEAWDMPPRHMRLALRWIMRKKNKEGARMLLVRLQRELERVADDVHHHGNQTQFRTTLSDTIPKLLAKLA